MLNPLNTLLQQQSNLLNLLENKTWIADLTNIIDDFKRQAAILLVPDIFDKTYYISTDGNDLNNGTFDNPFRTIEYAINKIPVGGYGKLILKSKLDPVTTANIAQEFKITKPIEIKNKVIDIENQDVTVPNKVTFLHYATNLSDKSVARYYTLNNITLTANSSINFFNLHIETPNLSESEYNDPTVNYFDSIFSRNKVNTKFAAITLKNTTSSISFNNCNIDLYSFDLISIPKEYTSSLNLFISNKTKLYKNKNHITSTITNNSYLLQLFTGNIKLIVEPNSLFQGNYTYSPSSSLYSSRSETAIPISDVINDTHTNLSLIDYNILS